MYGALAPPQGMESSLCSDGKDTYQALRSDGFFNLSLPGTVAGNLDPLNHLCLPK